MLKLTKTGIGLLTRQYRSVLHKCFLINIGLFALGAASVMAPNEAVAATAEEIAAAAAKADSGAYGGNVATVTEGTADDYSIKDSAGNYWKVTLNTANMTTDASKVTWSKVDSAGSNTVPVTYTGADGVTKTEYYQYALATGVVSNTRNANLTDSVTGGVYVGQNGTSASEGGALTTASGSSVGTITSDFVRNYITSTSSAKGGAILNTGTSAIGNITGDFTGNYVNATGEIRGAALYNGSGSASIGNITGDFIGNYGVSTSGKVYGGALLNEHGGIVGNITGDFIGNYAEATSSYVEGGGLYNYKSIMGDVTGNFVGNYIKSESSYGKGGAIYSGSDSINLGIMGNITGDFIGNYVETKIASMGGAILNDRSTVGNITGDFIGNYAKSTTGSSQGGVIYDNGIMGNITGNFIGNYAEGSTDSAGGALYHRSYALHTTFNITGDFIGNYVKSTTGGSQGGAIYRTTVVAGEIHTGNITGNFIGNYAEGSTDSFGGAISQSISNKAGSEGGATSIGNITGNFIGNYVRSSGGAYGGAIHNKRNDIADATIGDVTGNFINNYVQSTSGTVQGGAIWNSGTIGLLADTQDVTFYNNYTQTGSTKTYNDIYNTGTVNLNAASGQAVTFNGTIEGDDTAADNYLNIAQDDTYFAGEYNFNNTVENQTVTLGLAANANRAALLNLGSVKQDDGSTTYGSFSGSNVVNNTSGAHISTQNRHVSYDSDTAEVNSITNLALNQNLGLGIDVSLNSNGSYADKLNVASFSGSADGKKVIIDAINMAGTTYADSGTKTNGITSSTVQIASSNGGRYSLAPDILSNISGNNYYTQVTYDDAGNIVFSDKLVNESALNDALSGVSVDLTDYYTKFKKRHIFKVKDTQSDWV